MDRVPVNAVGPRPIRGRFDGPITLPNSAVALKPTPERNLPNPVPFLHPPLGLDVAQLVPERGRRVAEAVQRHPGGLAVLRRQLQVLLKFVDHGPPASVDAEVLERLLEVRDIRLPLGVEYLPPDERHQEEELLRRWQDQGADRGDVRLQRLPSDRHQVLRQRDPHFALLVLLLEHTPVRLVVRPLVRPHHVDQPVLGPPPLRAAVREEYGGAAHAEEAVGQEHGPLVTLVVVRGDDLGAYDDGVRVGVDLEEVPGKVDGDHSRAASHAGEVEALDVAPELVLVNDHGGEGRGRGEEAAVHDEDVDVLGLEARLR
ncbi:LOW QUALITY PROTEIN: hypothetical protein TorRG33x02_081760 [Trema orientale]|uniref:Uncharacterized protein n=1 Tax=Trema orientale TaxID=63057 RepID=A0A2P5FDS1_TREOI|nr:LOW QUALITY PROTEIN: hypothetical protein TorRG33x02_081760 [Trema orientale]